MCVQSIALHRLYLLASLPLPHVQAQPGLVVLQLAGRTEAPPLVHVLLVAGDHLDLHLGVAASLGPAGGHLATHVLVTELSYLADSVVLRGTKEGVAGILS